MSWLRGIKEKSHWIEPHQIVLLIGLSIVAAGIFEHIAHPGSVGDFEPTLYAINLTGTGVHHQLDGAGTYLWGLRLLTIQMKTHHMLFLRGLRCI
ncbi:MAG: hypothetical protein KGY80_02120 [Candidatus Thorarchaeota archaeon]|nr:hypothetical protein [Candidatus Thorarchaeota archaeon]